MQEFGIGASARRKEDDRFVAGRGQYTDDVVMQDQAYAYFVRSPYAHASIKSIDTSEAEQAPGVIAILSAKDVQADQLAPLTCGWVVHSKDGTPMHGAVHPLLAEEKVRYVGDHVAVVVAETRAQAKDAAELVFVDYEELPAVVSMTHAQADGTAQLHDDVPRNTVYDWQLGDKQAVEDAFSKADHVSRIVLTNSRLVPNPMEPRAATGSYDPSTESFTLYVTSQNPHVMRLTLSGFIQLAPEHKVRVIAPDVGGGFGSKAFVYPDEVLCLWSARKVGRPVKWTCERSEAFLGDAHGRDHETTAELALTAEGKVLGLTVETKANIGAYLSTFGSAVPSYFYAPLLSGQYDIPAIYATVDAVHTNTAPVDAYRGAGRPEATYVIERLMETAARDLKMDPAEIRRRNFVKSFPHKTPVLMEYDNGDYDACLDKALDYAQYDQFAERKAAAEASGKRRGIGFSCYIESCGVGPSRIMASMGAGIGQYESAEVRVNPTGSVEVMSGCHSHGQGHATTFAQLVADKFGIDFNDVEIVQGDTDKVQFGLGTYGSRSGPVGMTAVYRAADKVIAKAKKVAAHLMEAAESDIEFDKGSFKVAGTDKTVSWPEVSLAAYVGHAFPTDEIEPGLKEHAYHDPTNFTFPTGCHICEVEIDPDTGCIDIVNFVAVDDFGKVINPMIVEGQVHGGVAQGIGQALLEHSIYDPDSGQLITGSFMDYTMPRADDMPDLTVGFTETPALSNPLGIKGCGEAGAIAAPPAVINAITDALGVKELDMPATPEKIWRALQDQSAG